MAASPAVHTETPRRSLMRFYRSPEPSVRRHPALGSLRWFHGKNCLYIVILVCGPSRIASTAMLPSYKGTTLTQRHYRALRNFERKRSCPHEPPDFFSERLAPESCTEAWAAKLTAARLHWPLRLFFGRQAPTGATFYRAECEGLSAALGRLGQATRPERPNLHLHRGLQPASACRSAVFVAVRRPQRRFLTSAAALRSAGAWAPVYLCVRVRACAWFSMRACTCIYVGVFLWVCACVYVLGCGVCACVCLCVCGQERERVCVCACLYVRVFMCMCACMHVHVYVYVCVCVCVYVSVCVCARASVNAGVRAFACVCWVSVSVLCARVYVCVYLHEYLYMWIYI